LIYYQIKLVNDINITCLAFSSLFLGQSDSNELLLGHEIKLNQRPAFMKSVSACFSHDTINPRPYYLCSSITKDTFYDSGEFVELTASGISHDDDAFVSRISRKRSNISFLSIFCVSTISLFAYKRSE